MATAGLLCGLLALGCSSKPPPAAVAHVAAYDLLLVDQREPWLVALAAPIAAQLGGGGPPPPLVAVALPPGKPAATLLGRIDAQHTWLLTAAAVDPLPGELAALSPEITSVGRDPATASIALARHFWPTSDRAVVAATDDLPAVVRGAALAAHSRAPLLLRDPHDDGQLLAALRQLRARQVAVVGSQAVPDWAKSLPGAVETLDAVAAERRVLERLGAEKVQSLVLAREPQPCQPVGQTAWYAPYVSLVRGAPVLFCRGGAAAEAEQRVDDLLGSFARLRPRTLLILADYDSIETKPTVVGTAEPPPADDRPGRHAPPYNVEVEPCVPVDFSACVPLGVGRIPLRRLEDVSVMFLRGWLRPRLLGRQPDRALVVANSRPDSYPLPLCETVSRLTADEFKNLSIDVDEFYRTPSDDLEVLAATRAANLILYEGHFGHQKIFPVPHGEEEEVAEEEEDQPANGAHRTNVTPAAPAPPEPEAPPDAADDDDAVVQVDGPMDGLPVVFLQSCDSLKVKVIEQMQDLGGVALVGGSTPIHSASGSVFAKAMLGSVLYRGSTLGEALRDAQNYLFCVQELKHLRGHNQLAKVQRVALSFRLWGDPELAIFPQGLSPPHLPPVTARATSPRQVQFHLPESRLPAAVTDRYTAVMFPGSEAAGIVSRQADSPVRRVHPLYYCRMALPAGPAPPNLPPPAGEPSSLRAVFRVDPRRRWLYALYFPERETPGATLNVPLPAR